MAAPAPCYRDSSSPMTLTAPTMPVLTCAFSYCVYKQPFTRTEAYRVKNAQGFHDFCTEDCYMQYLCQNRQEHVLRDNPDKFHIGHWCNEDLADFRDVVLNRVKQIRKEQKAAAERIAAATEQRHQEQDGKNSA